MKTGFRNAGARQAGWTLRTWAPSNVGAILLTCAAGLIGGCPAPTDDGGFSGDFTDGNQDPTLTSPLGKTSGEPNGSFEQAIIAVFDETGGARIKGTVSRAGDLDVYRLGPLKAGDRVVIDADAADSALDSSIAVFDDLDNIVYENDDRGGSSSRALDALLDFIVRHDGDSYHMVVTQAAFASSGRRTGRYRATIGVTAGHEVPSPVRQVLFLDFNGAVVDSPILGQRTLRAFDAARLSSIYSGETATMKQAIIDTVRQNYQRFGITVRTSDDPPSSSVDFSTIYFGDFEPDLFGLAESVDLYNTDFCDDAIIFTETFAPFMFSSDPTAEEMGLAIGNVASHEAGHLLGLNHTNDDQELMDDESLADAFLFDQEFFQAPMSSDIMAIGYQDGSVLLFETVGPSSAAAGRRLWEPSTRWYGLTRRGPAQRQPAVIRMIRAPRPSAPK
jgi:hypothetical protein